MPRKKIEVVELNKKEEKIVLEEEQSALILFWRRYYKAIILILALLSLILISISIFLVMKNLKDSEEMIIKKTSIDTSLDELGELTINHSFDDEMAKKAFIDNNSVFKNRGEVLLIKTTETSKFIIRFYSDGTAVKILKANNTITRINPLEDGSYGISNDGIINSKAKTATVTVTRTKDYAWGKVTFYSDGSAEVSDSQMDLFVRYSGDVFDKYISDNKVAYLENTKEIGNIKLNYYHDGTIEVIKDNKSYLVRTKDDLNITDTDVTFKNNNEATIYETKKTKNGYTIDYYTDGGAIISNGSKTLSVRKSNSIIIKDDNLFEIIDSIYVTVSKQKDNVTYYTNGSAVIDKYQGNTLYIPENSNIKYNENNGITNIGDEVEKLTKQTSLGNESVKTFEKTAVVKTDKYIAIVPSSGVLYNPDGTINQITAEPASEDADKKTFTISNNTNEDLRYRVVIEQSPRTTIDVQYMRFQLKSSSTYIEPTRLDSKIWKEDEISKGLGIEGINYILIDDTITAQAAEEITLMLWTDYDTIPNSEMDKYFYGTIKVYAWTEK